MSQPSTVLIADYSLVLSSLQFCPYYKNVIVLALQKFNNEYTLKMYRNVYSNGAFQSDFFKNCIICMIFQFLIFLHCQQFISLEQSLVFSIQIDINSGLEISINIACGPAPVVTIYFFLYTLYLSFNALSLRLHNDIQWNVLAKKL